MQTLAIATVIKGVLESPIPRMMLPSTLYATIITDPAPQIEMYRFVCANASAGACIAVAIFPAIAGMSTVSSTPVPRNRTILVPMILPPDFLSPSPIFCPSRIVDPIAKELIRFVIVIMICEPTATPDTSSARAYCPTTIRSTAP